jgi:hypothetical protein
VKPGIHPEYRRVVFRDRAAGYAFLTRSTVRATPFWTGPGTEGRRHPTTSAAGAAGRPRGMGPLHLAGGSSNWLRCLCRKNIIPVQKPPTSSFHT